VDLEILRRLRRLSAAVIHTFYGWLYG